MAAEHKDIADPNRHEPKNISTASNNHVYRANGAGSGTWGQLPTASLDMTALNAAITTAMNDGTIGFERYFVATAVIPDISTAKIVYIPVPKSCTVLAASMVLGAAITVADAVISFKNAAAASLGATVTVPFSGSAAGDEFQFTATTNQSLTGPTYMTVETDGGSTTTAELYVTVAFKAILDI